MNLVKKVTVGLALGATLASGVIAASPAEAQRYYGRHYNRGNDAGTAIAAGVVGLAVGAAIASSNRDRYYDRGYYNDGYYDRGYYNRGYNYAPRGYYAPPPRGYRGYRGGYGPSYRNCFVQRGFDPYTGQRVRTRICR